MRLRRRKKVPTVCFRVRNPDGSSTVTMYATVGGTITVVTPFELSTGMANISGSTRAVVEVVEVRNA